MLALRAPDDVLLAIKSLPMRGADFIALSARLSGDKCL